MYSLSPNRFFWFLSNYKLGCLILLYSGTHLTHEKHSTLCQWRRLISIHIAKHIEIEPDAIAGQGH